MELEHFATVSGDASSAEGSEGGASRFPCALRSLRNSPATHMRARARMTSEETCPVDCGRHDVGRELGKERRAMRGRFRGGSVASGTGD